MKFNFGSSVSGALSVSTKGEKRTRRVFDSTGGQAARDLAAAIHGFLTNPATIWSDVRFTDERLNKDKAATTWLQESNKLMHQEFSETNLHSELSRAYASYTAMDNSCILHEEENGKAHFRALHIGNVSQ